MLPLGGLFAFIGRQFGKILSLAFSWATIALFGRVAPDKELFVAAMAGAALLWPIVLVSLPQDTVADPLVERRAALQAKLFEVCVG